MEGFLVFDLHGSHGRGHGRVGPLVREGKLRYREDIRDGLDAAPAALRDLFTGDNDGKLLIRIA
jgi:NADPH-dependent curcumin reductase